MCWVKSFALWCTQPLSSYIVYIFPLPSRWWASTHTVHNYSILNINHHQEWNTSMESYSIPLSIENPFKFHADNLVIQYISGLENEYKFFGALHWSIILTRPTTDPLRFSYLLGKDLCPSSQCPIFIKSIIHHSRNV